MFTVSWLRSGESEPGQGLDVSCWTVSVLPHQRYEAAGGTCLTQERMMKKLDSAGSLSRVSHQHLVEETLELRRHLGVLQFRWRHVSDPSHGLQWRLIEERWFTVHHLNQHDAQ